MRRAAKPLGPAALRDSIIGARLKKQREDSLKAVRDSAGGKRGDTTRAAADTSKRTGGTPAANVSDSTAAKLRPAEAPPGGTQEQLSARFGFGRRQGPLVEPGDYMISLRTGAETLHQVVHVERVGAIVNAEEP